MDENRLFNEGKEIMLAKLPDSEESSFEYIFLYNNIKEDVKIISCFNSPQNYFNIFELESLPEKSDLKKNYEFIFEDAEKDEKNKKTYKISLDGKIWKRIRKNSLINVWMRNSIYEFYKEKINQKNNSNGKTV